MTFFPAGRQLISRANGDSALVLSEADQYRAVMAFSLRAGGCSPQPFRSLNFSVQQGDSPENVRRNLEILSVRLGIDPSGIATCRQVHGDEVAILDAVPRVRPQVDAMISAVPGVYPAIKTADCVPILLMDPVRRVSAAVHAGWRGTVKRITRKVVHIMKDRFKSRAQDIVAAVGPAIRGCCYEVDDTVLVPFRHSLPDGERYLATRGKQESGGERQTLDLAAANRAELEREGIPSENISDVALCTCCSPQLLFSHRRDGSPSGRHMSVVGFRE